MRSGSLCWWYTIGAVVTWPIFTYIIFRWSNSESLQESMREVNYVFSIVEGFFLALAWPITLTFALMALLLHLVA